MAPMYTIKRKNISVLDNDTVEKGDLLSSSLIDQCKGKECQLTSVAVPLNHTTSTMGKFGNTFASMESYLNVPTTVQKETSPQQNANSPIVTPKANKQRIKQQKKKLSKKMKRTLKKIGYDGQKSDFEIGEETKKTKRTSHHHSKRLSSRCNTSNGVVLGPSAFSSCDKEDAAIKNVDSTSSDTCSSSNRNSKESAFVVKTPATTVGPVMQSYSPTSVMELTPDTATNGDAGGIDEKKTSKKRKKEKRKNKKKEKAVTVVDNTTERSLGTTDGVNLSQCYVATIANDTRAIQSNIQNQLQLMIPLCNIQSPRSTFQVGDVLQYSNKDMIQCDKTYTKTFENSNNSCGADGVVEGTIGYGRNLRTKERGWFCLNTFIHRHQFEHHNDVVDYMCVGVKYHTSGLKMMTSRTTVGGGGIGYSGCAPSSDRKVKKKRKKTKKKKKKKRKR